MINQMSFRHFSAVNTLNGKPRRPDRKWRFSVTRVSDPTHSVKAAIKASASFNPLVSYSLESRTSCKFLLPELLSDFSQIFNGLLFCHPVQRRGFRGYAFTQFIPQFFRFCFLVFHYLSPCALSYYKKMVCQ